jgi:hypothetical protein
MYSIQDANYVSTFFFFFKFDFHNKNLCKLGIYYSYIAVIMEITSNIILWAYIPVHTHLHAVVLFDHLENNNVCGLLKQETFYWRT